MHPFERLIAWQRAHAVAVELYSLSAAWRDWDLRSQLRRCASSVAANIAEGAGCESQAAFARFIAFAQASASELRYHLRYAHDVGLLPATAFTDLDHRTQEVSRMLVALHRRLRTAAEEEREAGRPRIPRSPRIPE